MSRQVGFHLSSSKQEFPNGDTNYHGTEQGLDTTEGVRFRSTIASTPRTRIIENIQDNEGQKLSRRSTRMTSYNQSAEKERLERQRRFVEGSFSFRECNYFKPKKANESITDTTQCHCGAQKQEHPFGKTEFYEAGKVEREWNAACLEYCIPINAYGKIEFISNASETAHSNPTAEYVRISDKSADTVRNLKSTIRSKGDNTSNDDVKAVLFSMLELMNTYWGLMSPKLPSLCISVIGGAKNYKMAPKQQDVFSQGLIKAAQTTNAWIMTSGLNLGITKVVGESIADGEGFHSELKGKSRRLTCIGIAPWGYVLNKEILVNDPKEDPMSIAKKYTVSDEVGKGQPVSLNQHHTHYILVDDGKRRSYGGSYSTKFRALLEQEISFPSPDNTFVGQGIPVVLIIVEGGHDVFIDACASIETRVPVVICKNTGRAADVLAFAYKHAQRSDNNDPANDSQRLVFKDPNIVKNFDLRLDKVYTEESSREEANKKKEKAKDLIATILRDKKLVTVFDIKKRKAEDFDFAILNALIQKEESDDSSYMKQIQLALTWDRVDVAEKIFKGTRGIKQEHLYEWMNQALSEDKLTFVHLFLQNGVVMEKFLTKERLLHLYNNANRPETFRKALHFTFGAQTRTKDGLVTLLTVQYLIRKLVGAYRNANYEQDFQIKQNEMEKGNTSNSFRRPYTELFLWALLFGRHEMAKFMWERTEESIHLAIVATRVYQSMQKTLANYDTETKEKYAGYKAEFEMLAAGVLEECNVISPNYAIKLVDKEYVMWGDMSTLELAARASDKKFLSSVVAQNSLDSCWTKGLTASYLIILLCIFNPWLVYFQSIIKFKIPQEESNEHVVSVLKLSYSRKLRLFYSAPKTKFVISVISYLFFVAFYSYFLLFEMSSERITPVEIVIFIYIGSLILEELREILDAKADTLWEKLIIWFRFSEWNVLDLLLIILALLAAFLRISVTDLFIASRTIYCVAGILIFMRILRLYSASEYLGPKLVMIARMLRELLIFILIIGVALFCYGVTSLALLYPSRDFSGSILLDVVYEPYWQMHGDIYLDRATAVMDNCEKTFAFDSNTFQSPNNTVLCPQYHFLVPLFLAVYTMIGNILLLNLLIAIFTNIFQEVQDNSIEIWKFKMFILVSEFKYKAFLPIPFNILEDLFLVCRFLVRWCSNLKKKEEEKPTDMYGEMFDEIELQKMELLSFESMCRTSFIKECSKKEKGRLEKQLATITLKVDTLGQNLEELYKQIQCEVSIHHPQIEMPSIHRHESHVSAASVDTETSPRNRNDLNSQKDVEKDNELKVIGARLNNLEERITPYELKGMDSLNIPAPTRETFNASSLETEQLKRMEKRIAEMEKGTAEALSHIESFLRKMMIKKGFRGNIPAQEGSSPQHPPPRKN